MAGKKQNPDSTQKPEDAQSAGAAPTTVAAATDDAQDDDVRQDRAAQTHGSRAERERPKSGRRGVFPFVEPRPGQAQRWVRVMLENGAPDWDNFEKMRDIGWEPRPLTSIPQKQRRTPREGIPAEYQNALIVRGQMLCEMPKAWLEEMKAEKREAIRQASDAPLRQFREDTPLAARLDNEFEESRG